MKKRKDGRYQQQVTLPGGIKKYIYGKTQRELKEKKDQLLIQYGAGVTNPQNITLEEWAHVWWEEAKKGKTGYKSQELYLWTLNKYIIPSLGKMKLQEIRPVHLQRFINNVNKSLSAQTQILSTLNGIFGYAVKNGILFGNPAQYVEKHGKRETREALTTEQVKELLEKCKGTEYEPFARLGLYLGLRRGEMLALRWSDFDKDSHTVHIQRSMEVRGSIFVEKEPKTPSGNRIIPIPDHLWTYLMGIKKSSVFVITQADGTPFSVSYFGSLTKRIFKGLSFKMTTHMLRHTYATRLDLAGVPPKTCQYLLGHASIQMTKNTYTHILPEHIDQVRNILTNFD